MTNLQVTAEARTVVARAEHTVAEALLRIDAIARTNQAKVLDAFHAERVADADLHGTTGYGLGDEGRDKFERVFARVFQAPRALVRPQFVSGTHALKVGLFGMVRPGDEVLFATGKPYETLEAVVGIRETAGSLAEWGVSHAVVPLADSGKVDLRGVQLALRPNTRVVFFQRSRGYAERKALTMADLKDAIHAVRAMRSDVLIAVDNCYGEFVETTEPTDIGADLIMGSLIKNPGGGLAPTGGYVAGRTELVERAATVLTAPGVGAEVGPTAGFLRPFYQGLFMAPHVVAQAVKGSVLASAVLEQLGYDVSPLWHEERSDLVVRVSLGSEAKLLAFCEAVQASAPIDSFVHPDGGEMAGYANRVVMAAGTFVQGSTIEMSADAPVVAPYRVYFQGGLTYEHVYLTLERIVTSLM